MPAQLPFHLMLFPGEVIQVYTSDVTTALAAARDARPFLRGCGGCSVKSGEGYTLQCLLCNAADAAREGKSSLVVMQEHHMQRHGFTPDDFRASTRVFLVHGEARCFVWTAPNTVTQRLGLPQLSYLRAWSSPVPLPSSAAPSLPGEHHEWATLAFTHPFDYSQAHQEVSLVFEDEMAWYGYPRERAAEGVVLIWPKQEWKKAPARS